MDLKRLMIAAARLIFILFRCQSTEGKVLYLDCIFSTFLVYEYIIVRDGEHWNYLSVRMSLL